MNDNYSRNNEMDRISFWFAEPKVSQLPTFIFILSFCFVGFESIFYFYAMSHMRCFTDFNRWQFIETIYKYGSYFISVCLKKLQCIGAAHGLAIVLSPTRLEIPNFRFFFFRYNFFWHLAAVAAVDTGGGVDSHSTKLYSICLHRRTLSALLHIVMSLFANFFFAQMKEEWETRKREEEKQTVSLYYESGGVHASSDML